MKKLRYRDRISLVGNDFELYAIRNSAGKIKRETGNLRYTGLTIFAKINFEPIREILYSKYKDRLESYAAPIEFHSLNLIFHPLREILYYIQNIAVKLEIHNTDPI